jgi:hypothetical protein
MPARNYHIIPLSESAKAAVKSWMLLRGKPAGRHITFGPDFMRLDDFSFEVLRVSRRAGESLEETTLRLVLDDYDDLLFQRSFCTTH